MNPIKYDMLERKRDFVYSRLKLLSSLLKQKRLVGNDVHESALCHAMQLAIAGIIDVAQHIVIEKTGKEPSSYTDAIEQLGTLGILEPKFATDFARVAKLRNVLVHLYDNVDMKFLVSLVPKFIKDTKMFFKAVMK